MHLSSRPRTGYHAHPAAGGLSPDDFVALPTPYGGTVQYRLTTHDTSAALAWMPVDPQSPPAAEAAIPAGSVIIVHRQGEPFNLKLHPPTGL